MLFLSGLVKKVAVNIDKYLEILQDSLFVTDLKFCIVLFNLKQFYHRNVSKIVKFINRLVIK